MDVHPFSTRLNYSVRRSHVDRFMHKSLVHIGPRSSVLDLGGLKTAKRGTFDLGQETQNIVYANISLLHGTDVQADGAHIPFATDQFDVVICSELFEHVPHPPAIIREVNRVLKPGGILLITVPFLYRTHGDPYDYGRYTEQYWREQLTTAGFASVDIDHHGLFFSVLLDMSKQYVNRKLGRPWRWVVAPLFAMIQRWAQQLEAQSGVQNDSFVNSFTTGFGISARKR